VCLIYNRHMKSGKPTTHKPIHTWVFIAVSLLVLFVVVMFVNRHWFSDNYYRMKVEGIVKSQIKPLKSDLEAMGFENLNSLDTACKYNTYENHMYDSLTDYVHPEGGTFFECSSGVNRYIKLPTEAISDYKLSVAQLHNDLVANGWISRPDYPTIEWFNKILSGVDYQPDQLNQKKVGRFDCTTDFITSFSKQYSDSRLPAVTLDFRCSKSS
jgi:hypothetical protein